MKFSKAQQHATNMVTDAMSEAMETMAKHKYMCEEKSALYTMDDGTHFIVKVNVENFESEVVE